MSKHANSKSLEDDSDDHRLLLSPPKLETTNLNSGKSFSHASSRSRSKRTKPPKNKAILLIHGGAGTMARETSTPDSILAYKKVLEAALIAGYNVLQSGEGGEAMDAAVAAVSVLEGAVFVHTIVILCVCVLKYNFITIRLSAVQCRKRRGVQCRWEGVLYLLHAVFSYILKSAYTLRTSWKHRSCSPNHPAH